MSTKTKSKKPAESEDQPGLQPISIAESRRLLSLEEKIKHGFGHFIEVGEALVEIRDSRLYRLEFKTFEDYCRDKWHMSRPRVYQLVGTAAVAKNLSTMVDIPEPSSERQARPLTKLKEPEQQRAAWNKAVESSPTGHPTAKEVTLAVQEITSPATNEHQSDKESKEETTNHKSDQGDSWAIGFAQMAIEQLSRIRPDDPKRVAAGQKVIEWIHTHLT
jgi:hypothetical protein